MRWPHLSIRVKAVLSLITNKIATNELLNTKNGWKYRKGDYITRKKRDHT